MRGTEGRRRHCIRSARSKLERRRVRAGGCSSSYAGPHAVTGIGAADFCYDASGNETLGHDFSTASDRSTTWTAFNKPATISDGTDTVSFEYGADRARFRQINGDVTTLYVDGIFEREIVAGVKTDIHYIMAAGEAVAIYKSHEDTSEETLYLHKDHLGSVVEITDDSGTTVEDLLVESLSYDAFGQRRDATDWDGAALTPADTPRGYTGHEHLDDLNLVHMNGRVYDPEIGRMLSADPYVQFPGYSQSFNRYSYVLNNPLRYSPGGPARRSISNYCQTASLFSSRNPGMRSVALHSVRMDPALTSRMSRPARAPGIP